MKRYEYEAGSPGDRLDDINTYINERGASGWYLRFIIDGRYFWEREAAPIEMSLGLATLPRPVWEQVEDECNLNKPITAIKVVRLHTGLDLANAKDVIDAWRAGQRPRGWEAQS